MTAADGRPRAPRERLAWAVALLCGLAFFGLERAASREESLTWDETGYIAAGYVNVVDGDYRLNADHPPLMQKLSALPLLVMRLHEPPVEDPRVLRSENPRAT